MDLFRSESLILIFYSIVLFPGNSSHYRINGITVTYARYVKELEKIGIVTKARNCLVFQVGWQYLKCFKWLICKIYGGGTFTTFIIQLVNPSAFPQGAVESIALKDPKERTKMFEQISQSIEFAADYEKKKEALLKAKEDTQFHFNKKTSATVEKKQMFREQVEVRPEMSRNTHKNFDFKVTFLNPPVF